MNFKKLLIPAGMTLFFLSLTCIALAQPCPPGCPLAIPIDGGIGFLLVAGAAYGVKKIRQARN